MTLYRRPLRDGLKFVSPWGGERRRVKIDAGRILVLQHKGQAVFWPKDEDEFYAFYHADGAYWITPPDEPEPAPAELTDEQRRVVKAAAIRNVLDRAHSEPFPDNVDLARAIRELYEFMVDEFDREPMAVDAYILDAAARRAAVWAMKITDGGAS